MEKLIKLIQLVLAGSALVCTVILTIMHFQPTLLHFIVSVLLNTLVWTAVWISLKELKNED